MEALVRALAGGRCVVLDGGLGTELLGAPGVPPPRDEGSWGTEALVEAPAAVEAVHRRYAQLGCDVVSTDTWGLPALIARGGLPAPDSAQVHWMDLARAGVRVARQAVAASGRTGQCAVAFSLGAGLDSPDAAETVALLGRALDDDPPDLVLFETLSVLRPSLFDTVAALAALGLPLWLSFRRCRHGLCGVFGQHWGGPEGDAFGRAARRFADMGAAALLVNCIPPDHVDGMVSYLRDFTDLPLGVYPNLGYYTSQGWRFEPGVSGPDYAGMALRWRAEGAQIIGGCCGVSPEHIAAASQALQGVPAGQEAHPPAPAVDLTPTRGAPTRPWTDHRGRDLHPLPFPQLLAGEGVFAPTEGSLLIWTHLLTEGIGSGQRCLDVGCGAGLQTAQLALNGAAHVHAIDLDPAAVECTLVNAFRNGVADRVSAAAADLYAWVPEERYQVIVANLYQTPVDPLQQLSSHRPLDYWGRNLVDHLLAKLPEALAPDGVAYLLHLSILSQARTQALLDAHGLHADVVDLSLFGLSEHFRAALPQIEKVEAHTDAYHLDVAGTQTLVGYLLRVTRRPT